MQPSSISAPVESKPAAGARRSSAKVPKLDLPKLEVRGESRAAEHLGAAQARHQARRSVAVLAGRYAPRRPTLLHEAPELQRELMRKMEAGGQNLRPSVLLLEGPHKMSVTDIPKPEP